MEGTLEGLVTSVSSAANGKRRVLGEVQLEVDLSSIGRSISTKRLSEVLNDQRSLKEQFNATAQQLQKKEQKLDDLRKRLATRNGTAEKMEMEKGKLLGEMKQLSLEKEQLETLLQEELDFRKMIQLDSQKLVADIKASYEHKISKLKDELRMKGEVICIKEDLVKNLEKMIKKLHEEIRVVNEDLSKAKVQERATQEKMSKSTRESLSVLQSQLSDHSMELESQIKSIEDKHAADLQKTRKQHDEAVHQLKQLLTEKESELREVMGRLDESRKCREETLQELESLKGNMLKFELQLCERTSALKKKEEEVAEQSEKISSAQVQLETQLSERETALKEREKEIADKNEKIESLQMNEKHLLERINAFNQKDEEIAEKDKKIESLQRLEKRLHDRSATVREKNEEIFEKNKKIDSLEEVLKKEKEEHETCLKAKDKEIVEKTEKIESMQMNANIQREQLREKIIAMKQKDEEIVEKDKRIESLQKFETQVNEFQDTLKQKEDEIAEKSRKIETLQMNVSVLKEASTVLDNQLRDFETTFMQKIKELEACEKARTKLASENSSLREALQKSKIELNEHRSLKAFLERRVQELESDGKRCEDSFTDKVASLSGKVEELNVKNAELLSHTNKMAAEVESLNSEKEYFKTRFDEVNKDNITLTQELHKYLDSIFQLKHDNMELSELLKDTEEIAESRIVELKKLHATAIQAKDASNIQLQCTMGQQAKLIQFLQDQNELLRKKRK